MESLVALAEGEDSVVSPEPPKVETSEPADKGNGEDGGQLDTQGSEKEKDGQGEEPAVEEEEPKIELPTHIRVDFWSRTWGNMWLYLIYRLFRFAFVTFWFYFVPFFTMVLSYWLPSYFNNKYPEQAAIYAASAGEGD